MKKLLAILLCLALVVGCFAGCGKRRKRHYVPQDVFG